MRGRLPSAALTDEDWEILAYPRSADRAQWVGALVGVSLRADRRDADLMLMQMGMARCLRPAANYIRAMDLPTWEGVL